MNELELIGGARIGIANASYPFAVLKVKKELLELNVSIMGNLVFLPGDIISLEPYKQFSKFGVGIKINHKVAAYKSNLIFWTRKDPDWVIQQITSTGFTGSTDSPSSILSRSVTEKQQQGAYPLKKTHAIGIVVLWNLLIISGICQFILSGMQDMTTITTAAFVAMAMLFCTALLLLLSQNFRAFLLKPGRVRDDIKRMAIFIMIITGFMMLNFGIITPLVAPSNH